MSEGGVGVRIVADERIEVRPTLRVEYGGDGAGVAGVRAEAVDSLSGERDELAVAQQAGRAVQPGGVVRERLRHTGRPVHTKPEFSQPGLP